MDTFKNIVFVWLTLQLIIIGLAGGGINREISIKGCFDKQQKKEVLEFHDFWFPPLVPLVWFTDDLSRYYCEE